MKKTNSLIILVVFLVLIDCKKEDLEAPDRNTESTFGIRHDKTLSDYEKLALGNDPKLPDFAPVVFFEYTIKRKDFVATGVLISPNWILTAGHNFFDRSEQSSPAPVSDIKVKVGNDPNNSKATLTVAELVFHPTWIKSEQKYKDANDLCLVKLTNSYNNVTPAKLFSSSAETIGSQIWFSGFGDYSEQPGENKSLNSKMYAIENILDRKVSGLNTTDGSVIYPGGLLAIDFDSPKEHVNSLGDNVVDEDEKILGSGNSNPKPSEYEGMAVPGDSGGPLFIKNGNTWEVAGILSGATAEPFPGYRDWNYGGISIFMRVSPIIEWIKNVVK